MKRLAAILLSVSLVCALSLLGGTGTAANHVLFDAFDGAAIDPCAWEIRTSNNGHASQGGRLTLSVASDSPYSMARAETQVRFSGDLDIQVSYELGAGWNADIRGSGSYPRIASSLGIYVDDSTFIDLSRTRSRTSGTLNVYSSLSTAGLVSTTPTGSSEGRLRAVRRGQRVTLYAGNGSAWTKLSDVAFVTDPVRVYLACASLDGANAAEVQFDDFLVAEGTELRHSLVWTDAYTYDPEFYVGEFRGHSTKPSRQP